MPYLKQIRRSELDPFINGLLTLTLTEGDLNYIICRIARSIAFQKGDNYSAHNAVIGAIDCAKEEYRRRVLNIYEIQKIHENGDLEEFLK